LLHQRFLRIDGLAGDRVLGQQRMVTHQIKLRLLEQSLILEQLSLVLIKNRLIGARIDLHQEIAFFDHLAFLKGNRLQLPGDLSLDHHRREWRDRAEPVERNLKVSLRHRCGNHRDRTRRHESSAATRTCGRRARPPAIGNIGLMLRIIDHPGNGARDDEDSANPNKPAAHRGRLFGDQTGFLYVHGDL
jgi:hypothetical protein